MLDKYKEPRHQIYWHNLKPKAKTYTKWQKKEKARYKIIGKTPQALLNTSNSVYSYWVNKSHLKVFGRSDGYFDDQKASL